MRTRTLRWMGSLAILMTVAGVRPADAALSVTLSTDVPSGQLVGTPITMTVSATGTTDTPRYQFAVSKAGHEWRVLRDYSLSSRFTWATLDEGIHALRVRVVTLSGTEIAEASVPFVILSRATAGHSVSATAHPLVALFSAPACIKGELWVRFRAAGSQFWRTTTSKACTLESVNFYVAGMRANTTYVIQSVWQAGAQVVRSPQLMFTTGTPAVTLEPYQILNPFDPASSLLDSVLLQSSPAYATDLAGNLVWYYEPLAVDGGAGNLTRPLEGGTMLAILDNELLKGQVLREIDLAGNVVRETSAGRVSWLLALRGEDPITSIHHEAIRLANGHTLVFGSVERILTDVQGPGPVNVYGEMVIDLDENFQVAWTWNAFKKLDPARMAILGEVCASEGGGCPPLFKNSTANDWLHANSINYLPGDGSLILSLRHQDWVIKIDYRNGEGSGDVLWRLGEAGDFAIVDPNNDPWPWFSHQHDARMWPDGSLVLFDNGNTRVEGPNPVPGNSRGQVYRLNEQTMTATLVENFNLGGYSFALGSAELLLNGNYHFNSGILDGPPNPKAWSIEVSRLTNRPIAIFESQGASYRSFRLQGLYRP